MPVTEETLPAARAFLQAYAAAAPLDKPIEREEMLRAQELLEVALPLGLRAGYVETADGTPVALAIGELVGDTLYVHVEKARLDYAGAYQAIVSAFAIHEAAPTRSIPTARTTPARRGCAAPRRRITPCA